MNETRPRGGSLIAGIVATLAVTAYVIALLVVESQLGILILLAAGVFAAVAQPRQVAGSGPNVGFFEHRVGALVVMTVGHLAAFVVQIAEGDRARRTDLRAGRHDLAVGEDDLY